MKAVFNNTVLAESDDALEIEGNWYFPPDSVNFEHLSPTSTRTTCPWKGVAHYFSIEVNGKKLNDAAWTHPEPKEKATHLKGFVGFWKDVEIVS